MIPTTEGGSLGAILRQAREAKGLQLEEVSRITRIGRQHLTALEQDDLGALPNIAYARGFVRNYAGFLGLNADELVHLFEQAHAASHPPAMEKQTVKHYHFADILVSILQKKWFVPAVLVAVIGAIYLFSSDDGGQIEQQAPPPPSAVQQPMTSSTAVQAPMTSGHIIQQPQTTPAPAPVPPPAVSPTPVPSAKVPTRTPEQQAQPKPAVRQGMLLRLAVSEETWLNITIDGNISMHYELKAGDIIEWKGERSFTLDIGNAGGVTATLNGKRLSPLGARGSSAHVVITPAGIQQ